ncbi:uncharacterized protein YjbJ (UPF0337 family) [Streptomyces sp. SPB162]|nr:uncharacterized protein YjbJ (UPF0337 family) [Streptomyces sp. SPB162]
MAITDDIVKTLKDPTPLYAVAGTADLAAEKLQQVPALIERIRAEAPERFEKIRNTDPKVLQDRVAAQAKDAQTKVTEALGSVELDLKKIGESVQDFALQGVGRAAEAAVKVQETYGTLAERGKGAVGDLARRGGRRDRGDRRGGRARPAPGRRRVHLHPHGGRLGLRAGEEARREEGPRQEAGGQAGRVVRAAQRTGRARGACPARCACGTDTVAATVSRASGRLGHTDEKAVGDVLVTGFFGVVALVSWGLFLFALFAFIDAAVRREDAYRAADKKTKLFWLIVLGLAALVMKFFSIFDFLPAFGLVAVIVYMVDVRPALKQISGGGRRGGSSSDGPYGPFRR